MTYSQGDEEGVLLLWHSAHHANGEPQGYVLDIGAGDGTTYSNSRALIEHGWRALLVEPDFEAFGKLFELYKDNPNVTLINAAIDDRPGVVPFNKSVDCGLYSSVHVSSRFSDKTAGKYMAGTLTPAELITQFPDVPDVLSVDAEGASFDIIKAFAPSWAAGFKVLCVEHDNRAVEIAQWGKDHGLKTDYLDQQNIMLVRR